MKCVEGDLTWRLSAAAVVFLAVFAAQSARADEDGVSFWLPGQFGSLAAVPTTPGWSLGSIYYHTSVGASGSVAVARENRVGRFTTNADVGLNANLDSQANLLFLAPTYTFATPVLGGQLAVSMTGVFGGSSTSIDGTLTSALGPLAATRTGSISDSVTGVGDLYPMVTLKWNDGVHNWMTYATGDIPVGDYNPARLSNIGIGHGAIDIGGGYTYLDATTGREFSGVAGFTYNFENPDTQYQSGIDFHFDWGASQFLSKQLFVGLVGYAYQQITPDSGQLPVLGSFESRVLGVGPQIGYIFPVGNMQGYLNLKGYGEFAAVNRPSGWNAWLTFSISGPPPSATRN
ncbi:hypothetical protein GGR25_004787 [Kaistia hirudinis]|uniref:Phenol degradation protein meta n=1 Tax=Kaistia hirudinis TaxID=1293440 RepID=A0A840ATX6_9HYPH|nr:transporter [Kaistia hirudinis]MBB3933709.1 hypothetical protein [Kaistia hirudinis]